MVASGLDALFRPRGVAVMGASAVPGKIGNLVVRVARRPRLRRPGVPREPQW